MQILHLVDSGGMGGIERHIEIVCAAQRAIGLDARVLLIDDHAKNTWPARFLHVIFHTHLLAERAVWLTPCAPGARRWCIRMATKLAFWGA